MFEVRNYGFSGSFIFVVGQIELLRRLFHNFGNFCVMDVADMRKNMVLHLMVQPPSEPVDDFVFGAEVHRGKQLVDSPGIFHATCFIG